MNVTIITPPASEPITLDEAKAFLRVDGDDDDSVITDAIASARETIENLTGRQLITATLEGAMDSFAGDWIDRSQRLIDHRGAGHSRHDDLSIRLPRSPVQSVTSVQYIDGAGALQTLDPSLYIVDVRSITPRITPLFGTCWPPIRPQPNAVVVRFVAGWTTETLPARAKQLAKLVTLRDYEHRDDDKDLSVSIDRLMALLSTGEVR